MRPSNSLRLRCVDTPLSHVWIIRALAGDAPPPWPEPEPEPTQLWEPNEIGAIDSVLPAEVSPVIRRVKQAGTVLHRTRSRL